MDVNVTNVIFSSYFASATHGTILSDVNELRFAISTTSVYTNLIGECMNVLSTKIKFSEKTHVNIMYILKKHVHINLTCTLTFWHY